MMHPRGGIRRPRWRKSSYSAQTNCLEVAYLPGLVLVRNSKNPEGYTLRIPAAIWTSFIDSIRKIIAAGSIRLYRANVLAQLA